MLQHNDAISPYTYHDITLRCYHVILWILVIESDKLFELLEAEHHLPKVSIILLSGNYLNLRYLLLAPM